MDYNRIKTDGTRTDRYKVETTTYPLDLFGNDGEAYGRSWLMININILNSSKYMTEDAVLEKLTDEENEKLRANIINNRQVDISPEGAAASIGAAAGIVAGLGHFFTMGGTGLKSIAVGGKAAAVGTATVAAVGAAAGSMNRETKRLKEAIQLPMPNALAVNYGADWSAESTHMFDMMTRFGKAGADAIKNILSGGIGSLGESAGKLFTGASEAVAATALRSAGVVGGGLSIATGLAANPKKEMMFDGIQHRQFTIGYQFYPKSLKEALAIRKIIYLLKYHMHPEYKSDNRFTFIYPSEFELTFFTNGGVENQFVSRISTCVLTGINVNYTPDGLWTNFREGVPTNINISMTFQELGIHTKESIKKGF